MSEVRESPSGPKVSVTGAVDSVFGRTGAVVAQDGDYDSSQIDNDSTVTGVSVTEALNTLLAGSGGGTGAFSESFAGGNSASISANNTNANIGNSGWNYVQTGTGSTTMIPGETGAIGIRRVTSPTGSGQFANIYLGGLSAPCFDAANWGSCSWRARVDDVQGADQRCWFGVCRVPNLALGTDNSAGFFSQLAGAGSSLNYQTVTSLAGLGNTPQDTGVPVDALFHNFQMVRVSVNQIDFYIDGVLRTTHSTANGDGIPTGGLLPFGGARGGGAATFTDLDDFQFSPV